MNRPAHHAMPLTHLLLALAVMLVWGTNFVVIKLALAHLPALTLATLRFALAFLPLALVLKRPAVPWCNLASYGVLIGAGQFGLLFTAMRSDITPGLASLVVQVQVFFTIGLSMRLSGERIHRWQLLALGLAVVGLAIIAAHTDATATPLGLGLTVLAALCWSLGNMASRTAGPVNMLAYVVWSSLFAVPPLLGLALLTEGWPAMRAGIAAADAKTWAAVLWQSVGNTMFGYGVWGWLLSRHPATSVAPLALLVPIFGMSASSLLLHEALPGWKIAAFLFVMAGLALGIMWPQLAKRIQR